MSRFARKRRLPVALACACLGLLASSGTAAAQQATGGARFTPPPPPPKRATIVNGKAVAPAGAPRRVVRVIAYANRLVRKPYRYGGGHRPFASRLEAGYDCSGAVSYALFGGRLLRAPLDSTGFTRWGLRGPGRWITVYAHGGHAYLVVAGLRFDTSMHDPDAPGPRSGPRWSKRLRRSAAFVARHPRGY
jgi:hypothetical protein